MILRPALSLATLLLLGACDREALYGQSSFTENVEAAYAACSSEEISFLSTKQNLQTAFANCGSNKFANFAWSPDGRFVYFRLTHGGHIMDGEAKTIEAVPTEGPIARPTWVNNDILAIPLPEAEGDPDGPLRLAIYNHVAHNMEMRELPGLSEIRDLQPSLEDRKLLLTAIRGGRRAALLVDIDTGEISPAFPQISQPVERISLAPKADLLAWSGTDTTELLQASTGTSLAIYDGATRGIPHPDGRYLALEGLGEPISPFDQRTWNEISEEAQRREQARKEKWLETLPSWAPREQQPPEIQIVEISTGTRVRITGFFGDHVEWYAPRKYFMSFMLWGIEGKQVNRNVALTDLAERMRMVSKGEVPHGVELVLTEPTTTPGG